MEKKLIITLPYNKVKFRFVSSHYDVHIKGSCMLNNELHEFETYNFDNDGELLVNIYKLNLRNKLHWYWKQWKFEKCVGYHYSYPRPNQNGFYYRKPEWLYKKLFNWYYKNKI